jgi:hypothetical protein
MLVAITVSVSLTSTEKNSELHRLGNEWRSHQTDAALLLHAMENGRAGRQTTDEDAMELEQKMIRTRADSLFFEPLPGPAEPRPTLRRKSADRSAANSAEKERRCRHRPASG